MKAYDGWQIYAALIKLHTTTLHYFIAVELKQYQELIRYALDEFTIPGVTVVPGYFLKQFQRFNFV